MGLRPSLTRRSPLSMGTPMSQKAAAARAAITNRNGITPRPLCLVGAGSSATDGSHFQPAHQEFKTAELRIQGCRAIAQAYVQGTDFGKVASERRFGTGGASQVVHRSFMRRTRQLRARQSPSPLSRDLRALLPMTRRER